ncbi:COG1361 S-layer family protein [Methanofollis fontis]|uniref:CARDB domain-containing protein n=1 Tax=Methanofollis fontis TaxID=2052832 RepID=A0A483CTJ9_9EURY|nr:CARDB domain-containing protein [Methanofollis fontis]TAJ44703.1 hypothetical protein CUJ86_05225 [Methanofollis fontis]
MRLNLWIVLLIALLLPASACAADVDTYDAAAQVTVTDIAIDPAVLMEDDTATVTVTVQNTGTGSVAISRAALYGTDISVLNTGTYDSVGEIGAGTSKQFTFTVRADCADGIYYPSFYLDFRDAGSLRCPVPVTVQSNEVQISVMDIPDVFTADKKETVSLLVGNPRQNTVNGVTLTPSGEGIECTQSSVFIGNLAPDGSAEVSLDVSASQSTDLVLTVTYRNGINTHTEVLTLPIEVGISKTDPIMVVNNLEVTSSGSGYEVSGDVSNAGLEDAMSVIVTVGSPAKATDPYPMYVIGSLESDDFSSFEVTFSGQGLTSVPIVIDYKDRDGNDYQTTYTLDMNGGFASAGDNADASSVQASGFSGPGGGRGGMMMPGMSGAGFAGLPLLQIAGGIVVVIAAIVAWKKGLFSRARTALQNRRKKE